MKIGILGAMHEEIHLISSRMTEKIVTSFGNRKYTSGLFESQHCVVVFSRWGKVAAAQTATTLIIKFGVDRIIFTGVAGAVDSALEIGDVVISRSLVQHDMNASAVPAFSRFEIPLLGIVHFSADPKLITLAANATSQFLSTIEFSAIEQPLLEAYLIKNPKYSIGTIASGDQFIADEKKIRKLATAIDNLQCIEMEGAAVAQVCHEHQIPFVVIRAISDKANSTAINDFPRFVKNIARHYSYNILKEMLCNI